MGAPATVGVGVQYCPLPRQHSPRRRGCHSRLPRRSPPLPVPTMPPLPCRRPLLPVSRLQQPPRRRPDRPVCRPRTNPALTPRHRPDRPVCRPPLPIRSLHTRPALTPLARRRQPLPVRRLQQPPCRHHRCYRHHGRPRTHPVLTPRRSPDRLLCRPPLPVRRLRTRPALTHRLPHVRRCRSGLPLSSRTPPGRHRHDHHRRRHRFRGRTGENSRRRSPQNIPRCLPLTQQGCWARGATSACR